MPTERNKFGLARYIPEETKRQLRQEASFGCACCGIGIACYEHIEPEFNEAKEHDPQCMAYLCGNCHDKVTRGIWSKERIWDAKERPWCREHGKPYDAFDIGGSEISIWLGPNRISNIPIIIQVIDETLLRIDQPEAEGGPFRIFGHFYDANEKLLFTIAGLSLNSQPLGCPVGVVVP